MARKPVRALVKPEILIWARESAGYTLDEVAAGSGLAKAPQWESGELKPTINQLRILARKYKRPLAVFYLQEVPTDFQAISDFRRLHGGVLQRMTPQLQLQIRAAQERREIALDLLEEIGEEVSELSISANLDEDPEIVGTNVRRHLRITDAKQRAWRDKREAFNGWRSLIEESGVLVFQMDKVDTNEASGFAISETRLPAIAVNRADTPSRRTFSLMHEFAHLLLAKSGVSEFYIDVTRQPETEQVEVWCNAVAAASLLPREMFLNEDVVRAQEQGNIVWAEQGIDRLARVFSVSKVSIVRRLLTLGLTDRDFYSAKETEYANDYAAHLERKKASYADREFGGRNMPNEAFSLLGQNFIRTVLTPYHDDRITFRDVSEYLNLKTKHVPKVIQILHSETAQGRHKSIHRR